MLRLWIAFLCCVAVLAGCAGHDRAVLLPDQSGKSGTLVIKSAQGQEKTSLNKPYQGADIYSSGKIETRVLDPASVQKEFSQALAAQPPRPASFVVYFMEAKDELTPESKRMMEKINAELLNRPFPEISVIGHTDRVGTVMYNDALSLKRAEAVRRILVQSGIHTETIDIAGRGSRELLVPTEEGVSEPRNRRVEIIVR